MAPYTLLQLETAGIQSYVFGSNHLAQNIGASELVFRATTQWVQQTLEGVSNNIEAYDAEQGLALTADTVNDTGIEVEVIYAGGGNALLLFKQETEAIRFSRDLSRRVLDQARGLQFILARQSFDWNTGSLTEVHRQLREKVARRKANLVRSTPQLGLGVTATCMYTGLPAAGYSDDAAVVGQGAAAKTRNLGEEPKLVAVEVARKIEMENLGRERLKAVLPEAITEQFDVVYDFDEFGTKGEFNYLAVVHIDGNGMGDRFEALAEAYNSPAQNQEYINALRRFSTSIRQASFTALKNTAIYLVNSMQWDDAGRQYKFGGKVPIPRRDGQELLPFRPIIFGGDDITFVTEGRLGLALTARFLRELSKEPLIDGNPLYAKAGIAIINAHFPFSRTYDLAERLANSAKAAMIDNDLIPTGQDSANVIDWHYATTGVNFGLKEIRRREYTATTGDPLLMRPLRIDTNGHNDFIWQTWDVFTQLMDTFQNEDPWREARNKTQELRRKLRGGSKAVRLFMANYPQIKKLPEVPHNPEMAEQGWQGSRCGYYDALEALDFYVSLEPDLREEATE